MNVDISSRAASIQPRTLADARPAATAAVATAVGEREVLQARADAGETLSPVERGTLERLNRAAPKTVADFTLSNASKQDKADLKAALEYLQQTGPDGKPLSATAVDLLSKLPPGFKINITHNGDDSYDPNTNTINWDPRSALEVSSGAGKQSAALGLVHEVDHAVNGQSNPRPTGDGYDNTEEKRVITGSETTIAHDLGEPTRTDHGGTATENEASSTTHTEVEHPKGPSTGDIAHKVAEAAKEVVDRVKDLLKHIF